MRRSITTSPEIVRHIDGLTEANFKLLTRLISWLDPNEKAQLRIPMKSDTDSENSRTRIPIQIGQFSERSDALVLHIKKCPK
jgi:hypothetical protein